MNHYRYKGQEIDAIDLKMLIASKGLRVDSRVYDEFKEVYSVSPNRDRYTALVLSNGYVAPFRDMAPFLSQMREKYRLSQGEYERFMVQLDTPFEIKVLGDKPALFADGEFLEYVAFPARHDFYDQVTPNGMPYLGNALLQGNNEWLTFGCEWPCEFAVKGHPCQYCGAGNREMARARDGIAQRAVVSVEDMCAVIKYAAERKLFRFFQLTGGSTIDGLAETRHFRRFLDGINEICGRDMIEEDIVFYLTPPKDFGQLDYYIANGVDKLGMSVEVWDEGLAKIVTPGKIKYTTRERYLKALQYVVEKHGRGIAFCQFVAGCEPLETMFEGSVWLAERGITPVLSILSQSGLAINGKALPPDLDYYRRLKEFYLDLYARYDIIPAERVGENGCVEVEFYNEVHGVSR